METLETAGPTRVSAGSSGIDAPGGGIAGRQVTVIQPPRGWASIGFAEIWRYRDLLLLLVWRSFSANYRQSVIGIWWAVVKAIVSVGVFSVIFGRVVRLGPNNTPYPLWSYAGLLPWFYFSSSLTAISTSVAAGSHLLTKVYFPRLILPLAELAKGLIDFGIQFVFLVLLMLWYREDIAPGWGLMLIPVFLLYCIVASLSVGLWLAALNVKYRDIGHAVPFFVQVWMWVSPVVYDSNKIPENWRVLYGLNPMVGAIEAFRWAVLGLQAPDWEMMGASLAACSTLLIGGLFYFRKTESTFADLI